ncbi:MAG: 1-deoxy-D-xylulose-5-phosphate reductoisomerase [Pseudomonadales bacterium]
MAEKRQNIAILGSTGSIGVNTLDVVRRHAQSCQVFALAANSSVAPLLRQCEEFRPRYAVLRDRTAADELRQQIGEQGLPTEVLAGEEGLVSVAAHGEIDTVMAAIVGSVGLESTLAAVHAGKKVLLANKESLVMAGQQFMQAVRAADATLLPIDSEHNAIFQCMPGAYRAGEFPSEVQRIILTASGGPFRCTPLAELENISVEQAVAHPNWQMGRKISVDSATMMNKGLELIEASWLFNAKPADIDIVLHPQSVIHSLVQYVDGSVLAQMGNPDMRTPIAHGLAWPERIDAGVEPLDLIAVGQLQFEAPDYERFPCLALAREAAAAGGASPVILNAANEIAVQAFLDEHIKFTAIAAVIGHALAYTELYELDTLEVVKQQDQDARRVAAEYVASLVV